METGQSTIHTKYSLKKKPPLQPPTNPQIWGHSHLSYKLDEVPPKVFILYIFWRHANLIGPITQRNETMETSQNRSSILKHIVPPLYRWMEDTIFQGICDKSEVVWKTCWGKHCEIGEHIGNLKFPRPSFPHHRNKRPFIRYLTHGTSVGAAFTTATQLCITFLPLYNNTFFHSGCICYDHPRSFLLPQRLKLL